MKRTIATAPVQEQKTAGPGETGQLPTPSEAQIRALIDNYRQSWEKMNDRTRKMMLSHGGQTPEQFEHGLRQRMFIQPQLAAPPPSARSNPAAEPNSSTQLNLDVLQTMSSSTEDLSAIRDGNVKRVQNNGCAPQISARIADLRGKLAMYEHVLHPDAPVPINTSDKPSKPAARPANPASATLANDWFSNRRETPAPAATAAKRELDSVLGDDAPPMKTPAPKPADNAEQRKEAELEIARIKPELERLNGACVTSH